MSFYSLLPLIPQGDQKYWTLVRNDMLVLTMDMALYNLLVNSLYTAFILKKTETDKIFILYMIHHQFIHEDS